MALSEPPEAPAAFEPLLADDWYMRRVRLRQPELVGRVERYARAVADTPQDGVARSELGWALALLGRIDRALEELRHAVRLLPNEAEAHRRLGEVLYRDQQHESARVALEKALELASEPDARAHFYLGATLEALGDREAACAHFARARAAAPENPEAAVREALLLGAGKEEEAIALFEQALEVDPFHPAAALNLAFAYRRVGRKDAARDMLERHQEIGLLADLGVLRAPHTPKRYVEEAGYYARQKKLTEAKAVLEDGLARNPGDPTLETMWAELDAEDGDG